jgi:hypothetical protein
MQIPEVLQCNVCCVSGDILFVGKECGGGSTPEFLYIADPGYISRV